jgi:transposase
MTDNYDYSTLIASILNVKPDAIEAIIVAPEANGAVISLTLKKDPELVCPYCSLHDYKSIGFYKRKVVIDNDFIINEQVVLKTRRYLCSQCGRTFSDKAGIVPDNKKVSYKMILRIMELLKSPKMTFKGVSALTGVSVQTVTRVFDDHTHIPRKPFPEAICIDEVYTKVNSYKNSKYSCIFYDFYDQKILDVQPCRRKNFLSYYLDKIDKNELDNVKYVSIDMYQPYRDIVKRYFKKAIICVDSFHVVSHLNDDLNRLRIRIMKSYDPHSQEYYLLNQFRFLLLDRSVDLDNKGKYNKRFSRFLNYRQLLNMMLSIDPQLEEGYRLKEQYIMFNATADYDMAKEYIDTLVNEIASSGIEEFDEFITLQRNWRDEIINSFLRYRGRRISSGVAESINQTVASLLYNTKGIRDTERRRKRIMYAVNKEGFTII